MSRDNGRIALKNKSPFLRGLSRKKGQLSYSPMAGTPTTLSKSGMPRARREAFELFIPDIAGGFFPPEADFPGVFAREP